MTIQPNDERLKLIIAQTLGIKRDAVTDDATLAELGADILDMVYVVTGICDEFGVTFLWADIDGITVAGLLSAVEGKVKG